MAVTLGAGSGICLVARRAEDRHRRQPDVPAATGTPYTYDSTIYVMNADGSGQRRLTGTAGFEDSPAWSPDGQKIAFGRDGGVYVVNADGSGERRLTRNRAAFHGPCVVTRRAKDRLRETLGRGRHNLEIYVANADGRPS